jgi:hypothetical protein
MLNAIAKGRCFVIAGIYLSAREYQGTRREINLVMPDHHEDFEPRWAVS